MDSQSLTKELEERLGPDLAFLAPALGHVLQVGIRAGLAPYEQRAQHQERERYQGKIETLKAKMDKEHPGWEQHDEDMLSAYKFLGSSDLEHPKFGDKYSILYQLVKSRLAPEQPQRTASPTLEKQVALAKTNDDAFHLAVEAALQELGDMVDNEQ